MEDLSSWDTWPEVGEATKEFSLVVSIRPKAFGNNAAFFSSPPCIQLQLVDEEEELSRFAERFNLDRLRKREIDFFKSQSDQMTSLVER